MYLLKGRDKLKELQDFFKEALPSEEYDIINPFLEKLIKRNEMYIKYMEQTIKGL